VDGVHVLGPTNLAADVPVDASRMFSRNLVNLVTHLVKDGTLALDLADEITKGCLVAHGGEIVNGAVKQQLGA
jgi:NAD(P) transhydrogenase subunit alpha